LTNYTIAYTKGFKKELRKLSQSDQKNVLNKIYLLQQDPFYPSLRTQKLYSRENRFESSVNMDIRLIWDFEDDKIIIMLDVGHHNVLNKY